MLGLVKQAAGPGNLMLTECPVPLPAPGQVSVEVHGTGVCGTDLHIEAGEYPTAVPVILGHEVAGVVCSVGLGVDDNWLEARVVMETFFSTCGTCALCREGRPNLCPNRRSIGTHVDGGFAATIIVPASNLHRLPNELSLHAGTLTEPLACVCHAMLHPSVINPGDRAVVVGPGPMGLLAAQVARALGATVVVLGQVQDESRLEVARRLGLATTTSELDVGNADVSIDASGSAGGIGAALRCVRRGGRFIQLGLTGDDVDVPLDLIVMKELSTVTGFASTPRAWRSALSLITEERVALEPLVSTVAPLREWSSVFADLRLGRGMKSVIDPRLP